MGKRRKSAGNSSGTTPKQKNGSAASSAAPGASKARKPTAAAAASTKKRKKTGRGTTPVSASAGHASNDAAAKRVRQARSPPAKSSSTGSAVAVAAKATVTRVTSSLRAVTSSSTTVVARAQVKREGLSSQVVKGEHSSTREVDSRHSSAGHTRGQQHEMMQRTGHYAQQFHGQQQQQHPQQPQYAYTGHPGIYGGAAGGGSQLSPPHHHHHHHHHHQQQPQHFASGGRSAQVYQSSRGYGSQMQAMSHQHQPTQLPPHTFQPYLPQAASSNAASGVHTQRTYHPYELANLPYVAPSPASATAQNTATASANGSSSAAAATSPRSPDAGQGSGGASSSHEGSASVNPAAPINAQSMLSAAVMAMGMGGLTGGGSRGNSDAGGSSGAQLTDQFAQQENIVDDVSASGSLDLTRNTGQLKLDAVTSCVLEQDAVAVRVLGGSVVGKHTREFIPISQWFKLVVLYAPRIFTAQVSTVDINVYSANGSRNLIRIRCRFYLQGLRIVCQIHALN
eukprot:INCI17219.2.p1 GENE.INCI17219.2~~INCI17219.2.p1  ORF type:complete len:509 (+),score=91.48 INCI17219.2:1291-2817(+)